MNANKRLRGVGTGAQQQLANYDTGVSGFSLYIWFIAGWLREDQHTESEPWNRPWSEGIFTKSY
jgi:hypothetical protein